MKKITFFTAILVVLTFITSCNKDDDQTPITPVGDKVPEISAQTFTAAEDIADDVVIGTVAATDPESKSLTFALTQNSSDIFELTATGELSLATDKKLDYETATSYTLTVEVSDGTNKASADITVAVENVVEPFITTWKTTEANEEIIFQLNDELTYDFTIDWGDGSTDTNVTSTPKHAYVEPGVHTISVHGVVPAVRFEDESGGDGDEKKGRKGPISNASKLQTIEQWGDNEWNSFESAFFFCENMTYNATDIPNLTKVTELRFMFSGCTKFDGDLNNWNVSTITNMMGMFDSASSFNRDLDQWDVSNVTDMAQMFSGATLFNGNISTWNVGKVERMRFMFNDAAAFNGDISNWDVSTVRGMDTMFSDATSLMAI